MIPRNFHSFVERSRVKLLKIKYDCRSNTSQLPMPPVQASISRIDRCSLAGCSLFCSLFGATKSSGKLHLCILAGGLLGRRTSAASVVSAPSRIWRTCLIHHADLNLFPTNRLCIRHRFVCEFTRSSPIITLGKAQATVPVDGVAK